MSKIDEMIDLYAKEFTEADISEKKLDEDETKKKEAEFFFQNVAKIDGKSSRKSIDGVCPICQTRGYIHLSTFVCEKCGPFI